MIAIESKNMFNDADTIEQCINEVTSILVLLQKMQAKGFELYFTVENDESVFTHVASTISLDLLEWAGENHLVDELMEVQHAISHLILDEDFQVEEPLDMEFLKELVKKCSDNGQICLVCLRGFLLGEQIAE
jgi:hypothetical protein